VGGGGKGRKKEGEGKKGGDNNRADRFGGGSLWRHSPGWHEGEENPGQKEEKRKKEEGNSEAGGSSVL